MGLGASKEAGTPVTKQAGTAASGNASRANSVTNLKPANGTVAANGSQSGSGRRGRRRQTKRTNKKRK